MPQAPLPSGSTTPTLPVAPIIWGALMIAQIMYCVVAYILRPGDLAVSLPDFSDTLQLALSVAALAAIVAGFVAPGMFAAAIKNAWARSAAPDPMRRTGAELAVMIVRGGFFEVVGILGFVLVTRGAPASLMIPFAVVALTLMALFFPTPERLAQPFDD